MNIMLLLMPANVALNIRCAGPGPDHDDRDHKEAMVLSEGHIQRGLTVIAFSAVAADAVGIPAGTKQHGQIKWFFPDINAFPLSSAREVSVRCVQFRSA